MLLESKWLYVIFATLTFPDMPFEWRGILGSLRKDKARKPVICWSLAGLWTLTLSGEWGQRGGRRRQEIRRSQGMVLNFSWSRERMPPWTRSRVSEWTWPCGALEKKQTLRSHPPAFNGWPSYHLPCEFEHESLLLLLMGKNPNIYPLRGRERQ